MTGRGGIKLKLKLNSVDGRKCTIVVFILSGVENRRPNRVHILFYFY